MALISPRLAKFIGVAVLVIAVIFGLVQYGRVEQRKDTKIEQLESFTETKRRIDNVENSPTRDAAVERLRGHGLIRDSDM